MEAIQQMVKETQEGIVAYDSMDDREILCFIDILDMLGDNPMQSEIAGHMGTGSTNLGCRMCDVGGSKEYKKGDVGYASLYGVREKRNTNKFKLIPKKTDRKTAYTSRNKIPYLPAVWKSYSGRIHSQRRARLRIEGLDCTILLGEPQKASGGDCGVFSSGNRTC